MGFVRAQDSRPRASGHSRCVLDWVRLDSAAPEENRSADSSNRINDINDSAKFTNVSFPVWYDTLVRKWFDSVVRNP